MMLPLLLIPAIIGRVAQAGIEIPRYLRSLLHVFLWNIALFTIFFCLYLLIFWIQGQLSMVDCARLEHCAQM